MVLEELIAVLGWDLRGEEDLKRFQSGMRQAESQLSAFVTRASGLVTALGVAVGAGMAALGKSVMATTAEFEQYEATLTTIEGSTEKARKSLDWVGDFAKTTPYEIGDVTQAFVRLRAYGLDPMDGSLRAAGDAGSAMGLGLMSGVEALADAMTGENERLKAFGITASVAGDQVTYSWQENGKTLNTTLRKNGAEIAKFLQENFGRRFGGAMDRQSRTWNGMLSSLSDTWTDFQRRIGEAGFFDAMKEKLGQLSAYISKLDRDGTLDRWARGLSKALTAAADGVAIVALRIFKHFEKISDWADKHPRVLDAIKTGLIAIAAVKFPYLAGLLVLEDLLTALEGGDSIIGDFGTALKHFAEGDYSDFSDDLDAIGKGAAGLGVAAFAIRGFTSSLWPMALALGAVGAAFYLAKGFFDEMDKKAEAIKSVENPRTKPGYVEPMKEDRTGLYSNNPDGYLKPTDYAPGFEDEKQRLIQEEARRVGADKPAPKKQTAFERLAGDYIRSDADKSGQSLKQDTAQVATTPTNLQRVQNAAMNFSKTDTPKAAQAVNSTVNSTLNDNRNQAVSVNVGGVVVNGVQNVSGAVGAAVGAAVGSGAAGGAKRMTWHEAGDKI